MGIKIEDAARVKELVRKGRELTALYDVEGYENAVPLYREAIEAAPDCLEAYAGLAETYSFWGFRREISGLEGESLYGLALEYAGMALKLSPESAEAHRAMATALRRGPGADPARRLEEAKEAVKLDPLDSRNWGELWRANGYDPKDPALARALEIEPRQCGLHIDLGAVFCERGEYPKAVEELGKAVTINRRNALAWYDLAMCLDRMGDSAKARELLLKVRNMHPRDPLVESGLELVGGP